MRNARPMTDRELIERFIATHGVTRCPAAFVADTHVMLSDADVAAHRRRGVDPMGDIWRKEDPHKRFGRAMKIAAAKRRLRDVGA